jgi:hypothetical protein
VDCLNWSVVEASVGIVCASVPSLRPLFAQFVTMVTDATTRNKTWRGTRTDNIEVCSRAYILPRSVTDTIQLSSDVESAAHVDAPIALSSKSAPSTWVKITSEHEAKSSRSKRLSEIIPGKS